MSDHKEYADQPQKDGNIRISEEVIASIAALAAGDVEGVAALSQSAGMDIGDFLGKKPLTRGVKIQFDEQGVGVDLFVLMRYGIVIHETAKKIQDDVANAIESMTGMTVTGVNVTVTGISFEKEIKKTAE